MTEMATIDWFRRWGTSVFSENTAIYNFFFSLQQCSKHKLQKECQTALAK